MLWKSGKTILECMEHLCNTHPGMLLSKLIDLFQGQLWAIAHHFKTVDTQIN